MHYGQPVVISGIGIICSLGTNCLEVWGNLLNGSPNMGPVTLFDVGRHRIENCVVAEIPENSLHRKVEQLKSSGFNVPRKGRFRWMVLSAAIEAIEDADLDLSNPENRATGGVILGTMTGGSEEAERIALKLKVQKQRAEEAAKRAAQEAKKRAEAVKKAAEKKAKKAAKKVTKVFSSHKHKKHH